MRGFARFVQQVPKWLIDCSILRGGTMQAGENASCST
jgi:hypothetical protein